MAVDTPVQNSVPNHKSKDARFFRIALIIALVLMIGYCMMPKKEPVAPYVKTRYVPISYEELPGWGQDDLEKALPALRQSCIKVIDLPDDYKFTVDANISLKKWKQACVDLHEAFTFKTDTSYIAEHIKKWYTPHKIIPTKETEGMFTGYYEATLRGSYHRSDSYSYPVYGVPENLFEIDVSAFDPKAEKTKYIARAEEGKAVPFYSREEISDGALYRDEIEPILWTDNPVDLFIMQIQGSAAVDMDDGTTIRIGYAGNNGHKFKGIGTYMKEKGLIESMDMKVIRNWLYKNSQDAEFIMNKNPRYIFARITGADGAIGAFNVELTPKRSLAVDPRYIPLGMPLWLDTTAPDGKSLQRLMMAQDTGSAILGPIRGDFFWGSGEDAFDEACGMKSKGTYYALFPIED
jgi:membrane-bound lytic murein transglycosylase A